MDGDNFLLFQNKVFLMFIHLIRLIYDHYRNNNVHSCKINYAPATSSASYLLSITSLDLYLFSIREKLSLAILEMSNYQKVYSESKIMELRKEKKNSNSTISTS